MMRRFLANVGDLEAAKWLAHKENEMRVGEFLSTRIESLTSNERLRLYQSLFGFFKPFAVVTVRQRLKSEQDDRCLQALSVVAAIHL